MHPRHSAATCSVSIGRSVRWRKTLQIHWAMTWHLVRPARSSRFVRCGSVQMIRLHILYRSSHKTPCCNLSIRAACSGVPCCAVCSENIFYLSLSTVFRSSWRHERGTRDPWHCVPLCTEVTTTTTTGWHKKREFLKNPTKIEEIQEKKLLTEIEPLQLAF